MGATAQGEVLRVHAATPGGFTGRGRAAWGGAAAWAGQQLSGAPCRVCSPRGHTPTPTVDKGQTARSQLAAGAALQGLPQGPGHSVHALPRGVAAQQQSHFYDNRCPNTKKRTTFKTRKPTGKAAH